MKFSSSGFQFHSEKSDSKIKTHSESSEMTTMKLIIDVDTGVDDAHALMMALAHPNAQVLAITCVNGNTTLDNVCTNTIKLLQVCGRNDVPVYRGAESSLLGTQCLSTYHGQGGLGDVLLQADDWSEYLKKQHAVHALIELVNKYPGEITLVTLAPLTNIALALKLDPQFGKKLKQVVMMGGNIHGVGNITVSGEFNFFVDPEAAFVVLNEIGSLIKLVSWETCNENITDWAWADQWMNTNTDVGRFNKAISTKGFRHLKNINSAGFRSCDSMAMATVLEPTSVRSSERHFCTVELKGDHTRGQMIVDRHKLIAGGENNEKNVEIVTKIDTEIVQKLLTAAVNMK
ncbi:nucleoside hydrolase-like isoform X2 [Tubulanus polymorphus]|uniref:nucleoside hydrolase-like isoform X2 n=1 Tax=Tubulanus polymorphus TaxID=672921 RepID=UPI003DA643A8